MTDEDRLKILYYRKIENKSIVYITEKLNVHRNSIRNICNKSELSNDIIIKLNNQLGNEEIDEYDLYKYFQRTRQSKINQSDKKEIEKCCKKHLNCYLSPEELCVKLSIEYNIYKKHIIGYNPSKIDHLSLYENCYEFIPYTKKAKYIRKIRKIRDRIYPPKNYNEVYNFYQKTASYACTQISYSCFYNYARNYWNDFAQEYWEIINSKNITFGEYLDRYYYYDDNDDEIKKIK